MSMRAVVLLVMGVSLAAAQKGIPSVRRLGSLRSEPWRACERHANRMDPLAPFSIITQEFNISLPTPVDNTLPWGFHPPVSSRAPA